MNKKQTPYIPLFLLLFCLLTGCGQGSKTSKPTADQQSTQSVEAATAYTPLTLAGFKEKINQKTPFYLYVGRPTCPYCELFSPKLQKAIAKTNSLVYYLNTDEEEDTDALIAFLNKEGIETIPHLAYYTESQKVDYVEAGSEATVEELHAFLILSPN